MQPGDYKRLPWLHASLYMCDASRDWQVVCPPQIASDSLSPIPWRIGGIGFEKQYLRTTDWADGDYMLDAIAHIRFSNVW